MLTATAFHQPADLDKRRKELRARLTRDPNAPPPQKFTKEELQQAAMQIMALIPKPTISS
jgi:hypothetical protein